MNLALLFENFRIAWRALLANKLRSGLTMLGIIIGVAALMSVGKGATADVTNRVQSLGTNLITVSPGRFFVRMNPGVADASAPMSGLYYGDYEVLVEAVGDLALAAPYYQLQATVKYESRQSQYSVIGITPEFAVVRSYTVARGRFLRDQDNAREARVAVLGAQTASELFSGLNPLGRRITINGVSFMVVGVLEAKGRVGGADDIVLIPLQTGYSRVFGRMASGRHRLLDIG